MRIFKNHLGIMQGRLLPPVNGKIQAFPAENWHKEFATAQVLGLDCIEFIFDGNAINSHPLLTSAGVSQIKLLEENTGVKVLSVCADYFMDNPLHLGPNPGKSMLLLQQLIQICAQLAIKIIVLPCVDQSRFQDEESISRFKMAILSCLPFAEEVGLTIALETDLDPTPFAAMLAEFSSSALSVNYDIGNSASLGFDPVEEFASYGPRITDIHIKDRMLRGGTVPLTIGCANFSKVVMELKEARYSGPFILQVARGIAGQEIATVKSQIEFVRKTFELGC